MLARVTLETIMDIELLKTFLEVSKTRHFGKAADNLYLTPAAVSARIKQMEDSLGTPLFIRSRNNIQLTAEGDRLISYAETILLSWSRAKQDIALKSEQKNQLAIGSTAGLWNYFFQNKLASIYSHLPDIAIRAVADNPEDLIRKVEERTLDIGILFNSPKTPQLTTVSAGKVKLVLASTRPSVTTKEALTDNYIYVDWGTAFNIFHAKKFSDTAPSILHTDVASIAESFMTNHPSSAYLPESMVELSTVKDLHIIKGAPSFSREVSIIYRSNSERIELIQRTLPLLIN